jgi:TetR/AcrR family transcriptional regulator, tetracycline repressor protein
MDDEETSMGREAAVVDTVPARRPGPKRTLSERQILEAALSLLSDGGASAVTIRGIAARVDVAPNAVYTYFPDKAAVLRALVERLLGEVSLDQLTDRRSSWQERIQSLALRFRSHLLSHPGAIGLLLEGAMDGPNALALGETLLEVFTDAGLGPDDAARASYLFTAYVLGSIALEAAELNRSATPTPEHQHVATRLADLATVLASDYPRTAAAAPTMARYISTEQFTWGLHQVLAGLQQSIRQSPTEQPQQP